MGRKMDPREVEAEVAALSDLDLAGLREKWEALYGNPPPKSLRRAFLIRACAYQIQVLAFGGLRPATKKRLREIAEAARNGNLETVLAALRIKPGVRLVRSWKGTTHVVTVLADGSFEWNGTRYRSLSAIAKAITGTSWNGFAFFGLKTASRGTTAVDNDNAAEPPDRERQRRPVRKRAP